MVCGTVCVMAQCPSIRPSVQYINRCSSVRRVCCCGSVGGDIDRFLHGRRRTATAPQQHDAQQQMHASSVMFTAAVEGWTDLFYLHCVAKTAVWYPAAFYSSILLILLLLLFLFAANNSTTVRGTVTTRFRCGGQVYSRLLFNTSSGFRLAKNIHIGWLRPSHSKIRFRRFWVMVCFMQLSLISRFFVIMC